MFDSDESSSFSSDVYVKFGTFYKGTKSKNENYLEDTVPQFSTNEFFKHFRVSREVANGIADTFQRSEYFFHETGAYGKLSSSHYTLIYLWFTGHEVASYRNVADKFGISLSTLRKIIKRMTYFLSNLSPQVIVWPSPDEQLHIKQQFSANGFRGVIGVIDGGHIRIDKPYEDPDLYLNRKGYYSMQIQVVCDHKKKITDIMVGFPGSVHDSRVFRASILSRTLPEKCQNNYILGDNGYPCLRNLLTPYKDLGTLTRRQRNYNIKLAKTRYVIEHCFGILKQKFRQLYHLKLRGEHDIANFIRACCVIHNLAIEDNFLIPDIQKPIQNNLEVILTDHNYSLPPKENGDERDGIQMRNQIMAMLPSN